MKIVELVLSDLEDELTGFDAVALVENPAHQADFYAFNDELHESILYWILKHETLSQIREEFISKRAGESKQEYISRCIPVVKSEGYSEDQAAAICYSDWESFNETADPQEIIIGDYQTRHYDMCPGASALYRKIESQEIDTDMGLAIRAAKLQDVLFYLEKHTIKQMGKASFDDVKAAEMLAKEIMTLAQMMGLEEEHQYIDGHVQAIRELYLQTENAMELDPSALPDFINELRNDKRQEFESYTDYPESATNAAKRALKWRDSHPDNDCGTRVGWTRANQLANRRPISEETIARMASFARHLQYEDVPYSEGCGGLMVDAWGGRAGINWAQSKLDEIREEQSKQEFVENAGGFSVGDYVSWTYAGRSGDDDRGRGQITDLRIQGTLKVPGTSYEMSPTEERPAALIKTRSGQVVGQYTDKLRQIQKPDSWPFAFSIEDDQQIVVGPLIIPNKLILRVDEDQNPYYVYFTEETVQQIARKMMEEKKLDAINLEHQQDNIVDGHLIETWIVEDEQSDKQNIYGMDYPKGTWMGMYKVDDDEVWKQVKQGKLKGFSIEGYFADKLIQN